MERVIIQFKDSSLNTINIEGTDIFEQDEYLHVYNGKDLACIVLRSEIKVIHKSTKGGAANGKYDNI